MERVDHGNRAVEDEALVARLRDDRIPLTTCRLSNLKLRVIDDLAAHPIRRMLGLSIEEIGALARNSFAASFVQDPTRDVKGVETGEC